MNNWTYIMQNFMEWSTQGYVSALGFLFYPILFTGIIGYVYLKQQSLVAVAAAILIIFSAFGNALVDVEPFMNFLYISVSLIVTALVLWFILKRRR